MHQRDWKLINLRDSELLPAALARPRSNATARVLSQADWLRRDKHSGRYLQAQFGGGRWRSLGAEHRSGSRWSIAPEVEAAHPQLHRLRAALRRLQIDDDYGEQHGLALVAEPRVLDFAGYDRYRRPLWLLAPAARAWLRMRRAAGEQHILLDAISGYRGHAYQLGIFRRKLARGLTVDEILRVNAAPGYSEHHSGRALDIGTPGQRAAEESFEHTSAFAWLLQHAAQFGFRLSYPRDNPHGIVYEPWHWYYLGQDATRLQQLSQAPGML